MMNFIKGKMVRGLKNTYHFILSVLANLFYGFPARKLRVVGVTGTDGKTTTANLIYHILKKNGKRVGLVTSISAVVGNNEKTHTGLHTTTPGPFALQSMLRKMVKSNLEYAVLEVTSHGIDQHRILGIPFNIAVLSNVTHEHLDYHRSFKNYMETKAKLFARSSLSILNREDKSFDFISRISKGTISYGLKDTSDYYASNIECSEEGTAFALKVKGLKNPKVVRTPLVGIYNVLNTLAAIAVGVSLGVDLDSAIKSLTSFSSPPGRFEKIPLSGAPFTVIVDFAHTPNALKNLLKLCRNIYGRSRYLAVVFGCAGLRDKDKRPLMGAIAARYSNFTIITAEDPRTEDLSKICNQIAAGCVKGGGRRWKTFVIIYDRRKAIEYALKNAKKDSVILITGKGHEQSMCFGKKEIPWDDRKVVREVWDNLKKRKT